VRCFTHAATCLKYLKHEDCDLLITDVKMPKMDGIELLTQTKHILPRLPVLLITGYGDIPMAVAAMKAGASDFIEKPLNRQNLLTTVNLVLEKTTAAEKPLENPLSKAQMKVLMLLLEGKSNKQIADLLDRSIRTIEDHRHNIKKILGVDNLIDLFKRAVQLRLIKPFKKRK
jgi:two-component system response regulator TtrR